MVRDDDFMPDRDFEGLRDQVTIAARRMSKIQILDLCEAIREAQRRRDESGDWSRACNGGVFGFA
jgi:hypothetical protein